MTDQKTEDRIAALFLFVAYWGTRTFKWVAYFWALVFALEGDWIVAWLMMAGSIIIYKTEFIAKKEMLAHV